jgi:hypothetical protein
LWETEEFAGPVPNHRLGPLHGRQCKGEQQMNALGRQLRLSYIVICGFNFMFEHGRSGDAALILNADENANHEFA